MEGLHVLIKEQEGYIFDKSSGILSMPKAGVFQVTIKEYHDEYQEIDQKIKTAEQKKLEAEKEMNDEVSKQKKTWDNLNNTEKKLLNGKVKHLYERNEELTQHVSKLRNKQANLKAKYADVRWICWAIYENPEFSKESFNEDFVKGSLTHNVDFSKVFEGGGFIYIEPYHYDPITIITKVDGKIITKQKQFYPQNKAPFGCFVRASGEPKIITAQWKTHDGKTLTEEDEVAFGSTVYLHVYTDGLFGQEIQVQLKDKKYQNADLTLTEADEDGQPIKKLDPNAVNAYFVRKVKLYDYPEDKPQLFPPPGAITSLLLKDDNNKKDDKRTLYPNVQKCVFPVFIEHKWQFQGAGSKMNSEKWYSFDSGKKLEINPVIHHKAIEDGKIELDEIILAVSKENGKLYEGELKGNSPVLVDSSTPPTRDERLRKDFTFGIFIDGTMNNKYNTNARIAWEKKRLGEKEDNYNEAEHLKVYAKRKREVRKDDYKYAEVSYENDLSNPAILYQNYQDDLINAKSPIIKVYTEGMGTNTLADEREIVEEYINDDSFQGSGLGMGSAGIIKRVTRAIVQMNKRIVTKGNQTIGTLTIDVFGFSRGAAAARHFVHEITLNPYYTGGSNVDHSDRVIDEKYGSQIFPSNGYLGYLLSERHLTFDRLIIRFAGLYDTVAHHGPVQFNDATDLGLNSITAHAKNIVHMVAGDEHRYNFSLTRIQPKKNHIELNFPGVHCDVGGSYVEGRPEGIVPGLKTADYEEPHILGEEETYLFLGSEKLEKLQKAVIEEGWFLPGQIRLKNDREGTEMYGRTGLRRKANFSLESQRPYISNQYSFIPLHMMCNYGMKFEVPFVLSDLKKNKNFNTNTIYEDNVPFLQKIKSALKEYAKKVDESPNSDVKYEIEEEDLKKLRNRYLHYNAVIGLVNKPEEGRKRGEIQ